MTTRARNAHGFSLVEMLVALVVLSVGMLGIAALYVESLHAGRTAQYRTVAIALASDMADRVRSNRSGAANYAKLDTDTGAANGKCAPGGAGGCTPAVMAAHDIFQWNQAVQAQLPDGACNINFVAGAPNSYTITIKWREAGQDDLAQFVMSIQA